MTNLYRIYKKFKLKKISKDQSGQVLVFVVVVLLILSVVLLAIVANARLDLKKTSTERKYEQAYSKAESVLTEINSKGINSSNISSIGFNNINNNFTNLCKIGYTCKGKLEIDSDGKRYYTIVKFKDLSNKISGINVNKDETIEVILCDAESCPTSGTVNINWENAPAISAMLVCKNYSSVRAAICKSNCGNFENFVSYSDIYTTTKEKPFNLASCPDGAKFLRIRAIGADLTNLNIQGDGFTLPVQQIEIAVQSFEVDANGNMIGSTPGPELVSTRLINDRWMPAIFDYVLYQASGVVKKEE